MGKTKKKDHRSASLTRRQSTREVKQSFLIVCEGVRTEPDYFKAFRMTAATVKAVGQAMNTTSLVSKAISIRDADQKKKRTYDQCWVVFDKDDFQAIYNFSTPDSVYALGAAVSDMSREVLRNIERTVKTTIRRRNAERSQYEYEQQERDLLDICMM